MKKKKENPYFYFDNAILTSNLFNMYEQMIIIYLIGLSENEKTKKIDIVNELTISISEFAEKTKMSRTGIANYLRRLEKKGVLVKINNESEEEGYMANTYKLLNFASVWDCKTLEELKNETDRIKREVLLNGE